MHKFLPLFNEPNRIITIPNFFTDGDIKDLQNLVSTLPLELGGTGENRNNPKIIPQRKSEIKWIRETNNSIWIFNKLKSIIEEANSFSWRFNLKGWRDNIQYTQYPSQIQGHFDWHLDLGIKQLSHRKLSLTIQLSDENDYEGGEFQTLTSLNPINHTKTKGTLIIFPSYILHRVTPITKGTRKSLVWWVGGCPFS